MKWIIHLQVCLPILKKEKSQVFEPVSSGINVICHWVISYPNFTEEIILPDIYLLTRSTHIQTLKSISLVFSFLEMSNCARLFFKLSFHDKNHYSTEPVKKRSFLVGQTTFTAKSGTDVNPSTRKTVLKYAEWIGFILYSIFLSAETYKSYIF